VTSWGQLYAVFAHTAEKYQHIDFVFANAGIAQGPAELLEDQLDADGKLKAPSTKIVDINLVGVIYSIHILPSACL
jgi:NAD(P)-dependent dehydrogenase (short-subunit alcohol dehydrogenase family)